MIDTAEDFVKEKANLQNKNKNLIIDYQLLQKEKQESKEELKFEYENKIGHIEHKYKKRIKELEKENKSINKVIDKFKDNLKKFLKWLCHKFSYPCQDDLIRDFNKETYSNINLEKQLDISHLQKEDNEIDFKMQKGFDKYENRLQKMWRLFYS